MPTKTFLFVDQVGSTEQLTILGDQAAHAVRRALFDLLRQATEVSGGHEVDFTGDGLFSAFDGAAEAVDAAVSMQQLCASFNQRQPVETRLALRIGLNAGEPLPSEGGGYFGVAVVVASRLCSSARAGQILASDIVRSLVEPRGVHTFRAVGALPLRGVPEPVTTYEVSWAPDTRPAALPERLAAMRSPDFVGRQAERQQITDAWELAKTGGRPMVLVSGDRGMGVSRLLAEAAEQLRLDGATVWFGRGSGTEERLASWTEAVTGWAQTTSRADLRLAMGAKAGDLARFVPSLVELVPRLPAPVPMNPDSETFLVAEALEELCVRWSQHQPILVVLDDLEEVDPASLTVLLRILESRRPMRLLVLGGYEPSAVGTPRLLAALRGLPDLVDLHLDGLGFAEVEQLVTALTDEPVTPESLRAVLAETEGSPYFVVSMAGSIRERRLTRRVQDAVGRAGQVRTDLRLRREEITLGLRQLEQLREPGEPATVEPIDTDGTPPVPGVSPYRGLVSFRPDDAANFFGRELLTAELLARLVSSRILAVVGPSGSGKSSVVNAGVLPALAAGAIPGSETWVPVTCTPGAVSLVDVLAEARSRTEGRPLVLVVDQFEQLWTHPGVEGRSRQLDVLVETATDDESHDVVILAMRADYYGRAAEHPGLAALMAESHLLVGPMSTSELRSAIESPARRAGLLLEPGLAQAVIDDLSEQPGNLPLLSTALLQTWERRRGRSLTLTGYAEAGGARRAIAHLADSAYHQLSPAEQDYARRALLRLAAPDADGADVARPAALTEFGDDDVARAVLARLADRRLITVGRSSVHLAHEALLREWPRLREWLAADREGRRLQHQVAAAAVEWEKTGRDDAALLRGARLAAAEDWAGTHPSDLNATEDEFVTASVEARQTELVRARRTARRLRLLAGGLVILLVSAIVASSLALVQRREAVGQRQEATLRANEADARGLAAQAISLSGSKVDTALLLAVEGYRRNPSLDTQTGLLSALSGARYLSGYHPTLPRDAYDMALSPDRRTLVVSTTGGEIRRFSTADWKPVGGPLVRGVKTPGVVTVSRDGRRLAYGDADGVRTVELSTGKQVGAALGGPVGFTQAFSRDSSTLVTSTEGVPGAVAFDLASGRKIGAVSTAAAPVALDVSPRADEMVVAPPDKLVVRRHQLAGRPLGPEVSVEDRGSVRLLSYSPDGRRIALGHDGGVVQVVDATTLAPVGRSFTSRSANRVVDLSFTPSGRAVAAATDDGSVRVADVETGEVVATFAGLTGAVLCEFLDEHRLLAVTTSEAAEFDLRRTTSLGTPVPQERAVLAVQTTAGEQPGLAVGEVGRLGQVTAATLTKPVWGEAPSRRTDWVAVSADGRVAAWHEVSAGPGQLGAVLVTDVSSGALRARVPIPGDVSEAFGSARLAFSADASRLAVGTGEGRLTVIDVPAARVVFGDRPVDFTVLPALRWSADGSLYAGGQEGVLKSVDAVTGRVEWSLPLSPGVALTDIDRVPGTPLLAVASESGFVYLVDTAARRQSGEPLSAGGTGLQGLAVSANGSQVAALGGDGAVRLWHRPTGRAVGPPLAGHTTLAMAMTYSPDDRLITGGFDQQLIAWDLRPDSWVAQACLIVGRDLTEAEWQLYLQQREYRKTCSS